MIRKTKGLGLAFLAIVAMGALWAQAAQAVPTFTAAKFPATFIGTGENIGERFVTEAGAVECTTSHYSGELAAESSTATVHPTYTGCKAFGFLEATITTTGCNYVFHATEKVKEDHYRAHVDVSCEAGKAITIVASTCSAKVESQSGLTTVDFTNTTNTPTSPNDFDVKPTVEKIKYTVTNDGFLCPFNGTGAKTDGQYLTNAETETSSNKITIRCTSPPGTYVSCWVTGS
jgi:hypothetical protein